MNPPSNLGTTRLHMAKMRRQFGLKSMTNRPYVYCKACGNRLYSFKDQGLKCVNSQCGEYGKGQAQ